MSRKILIFSLAYTPFVGGAELAVKEITDRINREEYEFDMITCRFDSRLPKIERVGNILVHRVGLAKNAPSPEALTRFPLYLTKVFYPFLAFCKAITLQRRGRYDALWAIMAYMGFPAVFLKIFHRNIPLILTLQEGDAIEYMTRRLRIRLIFPLYKSIFKKATIIQAISKYLADFARAMGAKCPIVVIPNGVDLKNYPLPVTGYLLQQLKSELKISEDEKIVITTSRLVPKNGIDILIEAMRFLPDNVKLLVLGTGPLERELKLQATSYKLQAKVIMLGHVPPEHIPRYLHIADVFARPSRSEGLGSSFLEAMAARLPVIATPVGGIPDFLINRRTGLFCKVNDSQDLAEKINLLLRDATLRKHLGVNGKRLVEEKYDWNLIAERMKKEIFKYENGLYLI